MYLRTMKMVIVYVPTKRHLIKILLTMDALYMNLFSNGAVPTTLHFPCFNFVSLHGINMQTYLYRLKENALYSTQEYNQICHLHF